MLVREQGLDSPERMRVLNDKNVDDICKVMRKPGFKNTDGMPNKEWQVSVTANKNLKLAAFLLHHRWRCTLDWEVMGVNEDAVDLLTGQKKLEDECKDPNMLPKINKSDMAGTMEAIKEYLRSCFSVVRAPLAYVIRKIMLVQTYGEYPKYKTPDNEITTRMLHLLPDKNKILLDSDVQSNKALMAEYNIYNRSVYDMLNQRCKDTDLYSYVKQNNSTRDS